MLVRLHEPEPFVHAARNVRQHVGAVRIFELVHLFDPDPRVFAALLINQRLREDDLLTLTASTEATVEQLSMIAADKKWSYRYAIRKALVLNTRTPRSIAASQLRFLSRRDLIAIHENPSTSVYLRRCIERIPRHELSAGAAQID